MCAMNEEEWIDCTWVGTIKVFEKEPKKQENVEVIDDYDMRNKLGSRVRNVKSVFVRMEN